MSLNYTTYVEQIANLLVIPSTNANFQTMLPGMIDYAEGRIYRELDLVSMSVTDTSGSLTANSRDFSLPTSIGTFLVVDNVNVITPATATSSYGTRNPLVATTPDMIDATWPANATNTGLPLYWALINSSTIIVGPCPNSSYPMEIRGSQQPTPLSSSNPTTILTTLLPDLFVAASMVFGSGYTRDFSAQGDNPAQGMSWEQQYQALVASANDVELRKQYQSQGWTANDPNNVATPPRV